MKKFFSLVLALMLVCSLVITASAAGEGSITISGVSTDVDYEIYKLLDLESYNVTDGAYSYTVNPAWAGFFATPEALAYVTIDSAGYVTWTAAEDDETVAEFAKLALQYAKDHSIAPVKSSTVAGDFVITGTDGKFSNLDLGYYLVDSTAGALCGLTTTNPDASVIAKNHVPTIDKQVQEDLTGMWGDVNTADIGQTVNFMSIIHVAAGAENYVMHDKMDAGLTYKEVSEIHHVNSLGVNTKLTLGTDYTVETASLGDGCTFHVVFTDAFIDSLEPNDRIIVYYSAMLNRFAQAGTTGNHNESWLEYGEENFTTHDKTTTYTFSIDIVKTDSQHKLIDGAEFRIYDAATGGTEVEVVPLLESDEVTPVLDTNGNPMYRRAREDETGVPIVVKDGVVTVIGFDNGVYYLEETVAPDGYNKLTTRVKFTIADSNLDSVFTGSIYSAGSGVHVINKTGNMLPETGSMGTTMFILIGTVLVLAAGVLLVTKKRMGMIKD